MSIQCEIIKVGGRRCGNLATFVIIDPPSSKLACTDHCIQLLELDPSQPVYPIDEAVTVNHK